MHGRAFKASCLDVLSLRSHFNAVARPCLDTKYSSPFQPPLHHLCTMDNEEIQQFFGPQRRQHVWGANDGDWGKAMVQHYQKHVSPHPASTITTTIPRILHLIWLGPRPMPNESLVESWRQHHGDWEIQVWRNDNLPTEMQNQESFQYALQHKLYGMASDILRLEVLWKYGGVYVDIDYLCVAPLTSLQHLDFYCGASNTGCVEVNNGLLAARPESPIIKLVMDDIDAWFALNGRPLMLVSRFMDGDAAAASLLSDMDICRHTGPGLWTRILGTLFLQQQEVPDTIMVFPCSVFHPMPNTDRHLEMSEEQIVERYVVPNTTKAIHLWHCSWQSGSSTDEG